MGIFADKTVTLYNRHIDEEDGYEVYIPIVLNGVNLVETAGANISSSGLSDADTAKLFVDKSLIESLNRNFVTPKEYDKILNKEACFTFQTGDFFVKGDTSSQEVQRHAFYEYMHENFDGVYKITNIDEYKDIMPHYEIGGR